MRILVQHGSHYRYAKPAMLGPQMIRLRPTAHTRANIQSYGLHIEQPHRLLWQTDAYGNRIARARFEPGSRHPRFDVLVELVVDINPVNPFDFDVEKRWEYFPFDYAEHKSELLPFLGSKESILEGCPLLTELFEELPKKGHCVDTLVKINQLVNQRINYVIREEAGIWTPEETLENGKGSCRDSALLLMSVLRCLGFATRFVSGYLVQLRDEGMLPGEPRGVANDVVDLHAWTEVYLPGAGWIGFDATSGLLCGEGHIPLSATAEAQRSAPIEGAFEGDPDGADFEMTVTRLGHEPRPTMPYEDDVFERLLEAGDRADARLKVLGLKLTMGGEPTFNSRLHPNDDEWNGAALGPTKWTQGLQLAQELQRRLAPGGVLFYRQGKWYPGESLPRWAIDIISRRDGGPLWRESVAEPSDLSGIDAARTFAEAVARELGASDQLRPAYEDPWHFLQEEALLPQDIDPLAADVEDSEERRRLAKVLDRGLGTPVGYVLPMARSGGMFITDTWTFRRERLYLIPGDSPLGLRLPLGSLAGAPIVVQPIEEPFEPPDPRTVDPDEDEEEDGTEDSPTDADDGNGQSKRKKRDPEPFLDAGHKARQSGQPFVALPDQIPSLLAGPARLHSAICIEPRDGAVYVFVPPMPSADDFCALLALLDRARNTTGVDVRLEGYTPSMAPVLQRFSVTPDPGVLEVNLPPTFTSRGYAELVSEVFDAALHSGLHSEKYMLDGRQAGSGGGHHLTFGGPTPLTSPLIQRPQLLASLITFCQHHPSLSYLFNSLFVGPTSQSPRADEARGDTLYELEIALERAFQDHAGSPPWLGDLLFRHLLVDLTGNTHRAELCIDKLFDPQTAHGRQGLVEMRAFEMPPHPRMVVAQMLLMRSVLAALASKDYKKPLVRWGSRLHDQYMLPHWLWQDVLDVLAFLADHELPIEEDVLRPFLELRCPIAGRMEAEGIVVEVRNAIEPWHVLGEELTAQGTARYVDSSVERIEVRVEGLVPERHVLLANGHRLPLHPTGRAGEYVAGVRFRAWAPPHSLHAHLGIHHPIRFDLLDSWVKRSLGACAYHVWHPEGRGFDEAPLTRFEASARRAQRFTRESPLMHPVRDQPATPHPDSPYTLDLRRLRIDRPMPPDWHKLEEELKAAAESPLNPHPRL